ncbi:MAG: tRNA pseudouridine(55) synthase TruB [Candidatus Melainabacteria bacterium GWF2_37_15]|nr:MAG: tRNA pseudouridine(55) synthase TruB [Candidatus Melainabacteria bacterium GWF2_37_15]
MLFGIINVNKPKGFTSHHVVGKLRKILGIKQIGHTGTLDPLAVGVLPVCVGKATRIIQYLDTSKAYRAYILLGVRTDTYDTEGTILQKIEVIPDKKQIFALLEEFRGEIIQTPPIYSAVHYKGKRLYEYARKNIEIEDIPQRRVTINDIKLISIENSTVVVDIDCSGGTYIRSIAHDLGEKLGYGACLENLIRTRSGKFRIEDSFTLQEIENADPEKFLIPPQNVLDFEIIEISDEQKNEVCKGRYIEVGIEYKGLVQLIHNGTLIAIAKVDAGRIMPVKVLC